MDTAVVTKPTAETPAHLTNARPKDERPQGRNSGGAGGLVALGVLNERQEKFCHFLAMGKTQAEAAALAGYSGHGANASRIANIPLVQERVAELRLIYQSDAAVKIETAKAEVEKLIKEEKMGLSYFIQEFRANLELARQDGDIRAANDCLKHMAQMLGFMKAPKEDGDGAKKNDQPRTQIGIKIENNGTGSVGGPPGILIEDPDSVVDLAIEASGDSVP